MNQSSPSDLGPDLALEARERDLAASLGAGAPRADDAFTLTKAELAELLFERLGLNKRESKDMVEAFFEFVHASLARGQDVKLSGFGNFQVRRKAPRPGRNPRTGESIPIRARNVVTFHASHKLKAVVQGEIPPEGDFE